MKISERTYTIYKQTSAVTLAIVMILSFLSLFPVSSMKAESLTTSHTISYYSSYIQKLIGTPAKEWGDGGESTQCVELVNIM